MIIVEGEEISSGSAIMAAVLALRVGASSLDVVNGDGEKVRVEIPPGEYVKNLRMNILDAERRVGIRVLGR